MAKLHADELPIDEDLVHALVAGQFPRLGAVTPERIASTGTVNVLYRLGADHVARFPRLAEWGATIVHETTWLPVLAPRLPLEVPRPIGLGTPTDRFPAHWAILRWIEGQPAETAAWEPMSAATDLATFVRAMRSIDAEGAPMARPRERGGDLRLRDGQVRRLVADLGPEIEGPTLMRIWEDALEACETASEPAWVHTDLLPSNLVVRDGRMTAVIDFGSSCVGDPACDLTPAWSIFDAASAERFLGLASATDAATRRARGWVLDQALTALPYYRATNPSMVAMARRVLDALTGRAD